MKWVSTTYIVEVVDMNSKDTSVIPKGYYCYTPIGWDGDRYLTKPCPYREYTEYGTVRCNYLDVESIDPTPSGIESYQKAVEYFGSEDKVWKIDNGGLIWDAVKECGINDEEE